MSTFTQNKAAREPFGKNAYLRSTKDVKTDSYTFAQSGIPSEVIDGNVEKVLQPGTVIAKITSGPDTGKVGVFQGVGTDEVQRLTKAGTVSGGTFTLTVLGATTAAIAFDANAATIQAAIRLAIASDDTVSDELKAIGDGITVVGGPFSGATPVDVTFDGEVAADVAQITADVALLTGAGAASRPAPRPPALPVRPMAVAARPTSSASWTPSCPGSSSNAMSKSRWSTRPPWCRRGASSTPPQASVPLSGTPPATP